MPEPPTSGCIADTPASSGDTTAEIYLHEDTEQAGTADTDLALQSEQRACIAFKSCPCRRLNNMMPRSPLRPRSASMPRYLKSGPWRA